MASLMNRARMEVNAANPMDGHSSTCTIFKIPKHIRQLDDKAYDPVVASFGPFNNASPYSTSVTQDNKWQCVRHLLSRHGSSERANELLEICLKELVGLDKRVRSCYSGQIPLDAEALALIMLLDGCFIIYLMLKRKESLEKRKKENRTGEKTKEKVEDVVGNWEDETPKKDKGKNGEKENVVTKFEDETSKEDESKNRGERGIGEGEVVLNIQEEEGLLDGPTMVGLSTFYLAVYDLLKLENQIPFFVIELLLDWLKTIEDGNIDLVDLALQLFKDIHPNESRSFVKKSPGEYHHLLHLFYLSRILSEMPAKSTSARGCMHIPHVYPKWKTTEAAPIRRAWASAPRWTPNATELDRAGVKFKRKEPVDSFLNITFEWRKKMEMTPVLGLLKSFLMFKSGRMEIPSLQIYDYTGPLFQNLIAFEQCYFRTEMYITIYTLFMDCIIDQAEDVRLLHLKGILEHKLSNDQAVAELFNQLGSQIHFYWETDYLKNHIAKVIEGVNEFYEFKWHKWLAGLRRDYLGNPWSIISVFAAVILLLLTIEQAVFAALSYVKS